MKSFLLTLLWIFVIGGACISSSCVTTTTTAPDGTTTTVKQPVPGVLPFAGEVIKAYSPRRIEDGK